MPSFKMADGTEVSWDVPDGLNGPLDDENTLKRRKADGRQAAVEAWKKSAILSTKGQINQATMAVIALTIQLRALGGSLGDTDLGKRMHEAADFLEDL